MTTIRRTLPTLALAAGLAFAGAACDSRTSPDAPADLEGDIENTPQIEIEQEQDLDQDDGASGETGETES